MAVKNLRQRIVAFVAGLLLGPTVVWAGLESATYISDLVASNPLSSDLASTADDHIRLLKSTIKTTFPNINGAVTATDEQLSPGGLGANPSGTIGLSAVNGSASTYMRSDGAPPLSQAIAPTWTGAHSFTFTDATRVGPVVTNSAPGIDFIETGVAADNTVWRQVANAEQLTFQAVNDIISASGTWMTVDRTGTTVDRVAFPTEGSKAFSVGTPDGATYGSSRAEIRTTTASATALATRNVTSASASLVVVNEATSGDNSFIVFFTEAGAGTNRGNIDFNRAGTAVRYNTTSDQRLKKNIKAAGSARELINSIPIDEYDWKESGAHVAHGFVAQRLNKVAPECVSSSTDPKVIWAVEKACLVPALIKYVQEQDARIERLEADANRRH